MVGGGEEPADPSVSEAKADAPLPAAELEVVELWVGTWNIEETHFDVKGQIVATLKGTEEIGWKLNHHAVERAYTTRRPSDVFRAVGWLTWSEPQKSYVGVWINNAGLGGLVTQKGSWDAATRTMTFDVEASAADGRPERFKVVERFADEKTREATTFRIDPSGAVKMLEVRYTRSTPCPARVRIIFDN